MPYIGKSPSAGVRQRYQYTATAGQTTFSGADTGNLTLNYTDNNFVDVFQNGVLLKGGGTDYTATSGTSVVLATGASVSDVIEIIVYDVFSVGNFYSRTDSDSRYAKTTGATMTGDLTMGDASASDRKILFDGNAQDFHIGLDDSADSLTIGLGSTLGTTSHMVIDANGHITKPLQSAFSAECGTTHTDISTGTTTIIIDTEIFDQNGDFNTSNYTFTAPVTGKYQFSWAVQFSDLGGESASVTSYMLAILETSNRDYENPYFDFAIGDKTTDSHSLTASALVDMDANDTAILKIYNNMGTTSGDIAGNTSQMTTYLTGLLVC